MRVSVLPLLLIVVSVGSACGSSNAPTPSSVSVTAPAIQPTVPATPPATSVAAPPAASTIDGSLLRKVEGTYRFSMTAKDLKAVGFDQAGIAENANTSEFVLHGGVVTYSSSAYEVSTGKAACEADPDCIVRDTGRYVVDGGCLRFTFAKGNHDWGCYRVVEATDKRLLLAGPIGPVVWHASVGDIGPIVGLFFSNLGRGWPRVPEA